MRYKRIKDHSNLVRDSETNAIINISDNYHTYISNKRNNKIEKEKFLNYVDNLEYRISQLEKLLKEDK